MLWFEIKLLREHEEELS
jgi:DNA repair exonuclease SbcCD ATPase subunit